VDLTMKEVQNRILKIEGDIRVNATRAAAGGARQVQPVSMSPRTHPRGPDLLEDPWSTFRPGIGYNSAAAAPQPRQEPANQGGATEPQSSADPYYLAPRIADRHGLIFGGFGANSDRTEIEEVLRNIMEGALGVVRVQALGKFSTAGKVVFKDKSAMWDFIHSHKGQKFPHLGDPRAIWFSIENTNTERYSGKRSPRWSGHLLPT
jgi:hypothetical protein